MKGAHDLRRLVLQQVRDRSHRWTARRGRASTCSVSAFGSQVENSLNELVGACANRVKQQRFVAPEDFDERRTGPIGARGDMPDERRRLERHAGRERSEDDEPLAWLQVQGNPDGEFAVCLELLLEIGRRHKNTYENARLL